MTDAGTKFGAGLKPLVETGSARVSLGCEAPRASGALLPPELGRTLADDDVELAEVGPWLGERLATGVRAAGAGVMVLELVEAASGALRM